MSFGFTCPERITTAMIDANSDAYRRQYQNSLAYNQLRVYETPNFLLRFDMIDMLWAMCVKDVFTLDIDIKDGITREQAIANVQLYSDYWHVRGYDMLWQVIQTDRGVHFHLLSETIDNMSERAKGMAVDLCSDKFYIQFNATSEFCMRVSPKVVKADPKTGVRNFIPRKQVMEEYIGKSCVDNVCRIGYGTPNPYIVSTLNVYAQLIDFFTVTYREKYDEIMAPHIDSSKRSLINWKGIIYSYQNLPPLTFIEYVNKFVERTMKESGFNGKGEYIIPLKKYGYMEEYKPFLDANTLFQCSRSTLYEIERKAVQLIDGAWKENCIKQLIVIAGLDEPDLPESKLVPRKLIRNPNGRSYPFVFGLDLTSYMIFIQVPDLLMIDWDEKDGYGKAVAGSLMHNYLKNEESLPSTERVSHKPLLMKMYETDNGTHAYCVSDYLSYYERPGFDGVSRALRLMMRTCVDPWYIAFVKTRGFSTRIGPKAVNKKGIAGKRIEFKTDEEIQNQFVQRKGINIPGESGRTELIGSGKLDPYLNAMTEMIIDLQNHVMRNVKNLPNRLIDDPEELIIELGEYAKAYYDEKVRIQQDANYATYYENSGTWAHNIFRCPG